MLSSIMITGNGTLQTKSSNYHKEMREKASPPLSSFTLIADELLCIVPSDMTRACSDDPWNMTCTYAISPSY